MKVSELINYEAESSRLDFKLLPYDMSDKAKKHEFLKDMMSFANNPDQGDKYIIIGVKENNGLAHSFADIDEIDDQAILQQYLDSNIEPSIKFEYRLCQHGNFQLAYFRLYENLNRPYLFRKGVQVRGAGKKVSEKLIFREGEGYIRIGTSTKKMVREDFDAIYKNKNFTKDRSEDLEVELVKGEIGDDLSYLDWNVENISNKSIKLLVEVTLFTMSKDSIISLSNYNYRRAKIMEMNGRKSIVHDDLVAPNLNIFIETKENEFKVSLGRLSQDVYPLSIPQKTTIKNIFDKEIIIKNKSDVISARLVVLSDEFLMGPIQLDFDDIY